MQGFLVPELLKWFGLELLIQVYRSKLNLTGTDIPIFHRDKVNGRTFGMGKHRNLLFK